MIAIKPSLKAFLVLACFSLGMAQYLTAQEVAGNRFLGHRYFTFNTVVRVNQIETSRDVINGEDESGIHSPEGARIFRETIEKGWPGARITWAFSWLALKDERPNYSELKKLIVSYHEKYGDEITFLPGGYFANMYNTREQVNLDLHEGLQMVSDMVGGGYRPLSVIAGYLSAENLRYLSEEEGIHVCQGNIWSQYAIDNGDGDGSISYPYYPSKEHFLKPAQGKDDLIDCVNLDGWTMDFLSARYPGGRTINGEWCGSRQGVGPIETVIRLGTERGTKEMLAVTAAHFDKGFELNKFAWVTCTWELGLVEARKIYGYKGRNGMEGMLIWFSEMRRRWPDARCITLGEFGMLWREQYKNNNDLNYQFVQRGTDVCGSEPELEIQWFMNKDFRLAILRDWQANTPGNVIDFTRYDLKAQEPADPEPGKHSRNWSLMNRLNQKGIREQDKPIDINLLNKEEKTLISKWYPDLIEPSIVTQGQNGAPPSNAFSQVDENVFREKSGKNAGTQKDAVAVADTILNFNADWRFYLGESPGFYVPGFDDSGWRVLDVPHDWSVEGQFAEENPGGASGGYLPYGTGCYRKHFVLPDSSKGKRIIIRFDGVYMNSSVYLNGTYLGNRPYGFTTFEYDLTPYIKYKGEPNLLAVKVDNSITGNCRWYTGSGINRSVHLIISGQQHFKSFGTFFSTTSTDGKVARLKVDCEVISNNYPESMGINFQRFPEEWKKVLKKARIVALLKNREGGIFAKAIDSCELSDYTSVKSTMNMAAGNPVLWSDKNPYLYTLELQLWIEDRLVDTQQQKVGIRTIGFNKDEGMLVNGEKVILKGVCLHKDAGSFGTAVPKDVWRYRLEKLKELGCNAIRTHGPVDPPFIEVCDEKGFYLMVEAFDEWNKTWHYGQSEDPAGKKPGTYHLFFNQWAETDLKDMVRRDRNHASVFMYSVGNEVPDQRYPDGPKTLKKLIDWAKEEDDTRMITATCDWAPWANASGFFDAMDIAGYNYPDRYFKEQYREEHARYPNRILLGAENYLTLENWLAVRDNPYVTGLFLWVGIDYLGESLAWPRRGWEWGLIDIGGFEKTLYYYWQAFWSEKPMVHIAVNLKKKDDFEWRAYNVASHWNFNPGEVDTVFVYSNTEKVELFQNGKSLGQKPVNPNTYQAIYLVNYKKGELVATAFNKKGIVATHSLKTAGEPKKLVIKEEWKSDGPESERLVFLTLEIQDEKGTRCPTAKNEVTVDVTGAGELIGLDSGDQFSHELYKQNKRKAHEGRLLLTIRPKGKGSISVQCRAEGLESGTIKIQNLVTE